MFLLWIFWVSQSSSLFSSYARFSQEIDRKSVGAFIVQWGIGLVINQWPVRVNGNYDPAGHQLAFSLLVFFEICALIYFVWPRKK